MLNAKKSQKNRISILPRQTLQRPVGATFQPTDGCLLMASRLGQCQAKLDALEEELLLDDPAPARVRDIRENITKLEKLKAKLSGASSSGRYRYR